MTADSEEQEDEMLALHSILGAEEFVRKESGAAGEVRVSAELPVEFTVALTEGETVRQYEISFLPPLLLTFELPEDYPSSSPPSFTLTCSWLTNSQLSALRSRLADLYQATGSAVVLFSWVQFLREDALGFLGVGTRLELNLSAEFDSRIQPRAHSKNTNNQDAPTSGSTDDPSVKDSDRSAAPFSEVPNPSTSDSQGAGLLHQKTLNSELSNDSNQNAQVPESREAEQTVQPSEVESEEESDQIGLEEAHDAASSTPSGDLDTSEQGAASLTLLPRQPLHGEERTEVSPTPSQALLSELLIYDAAQRQRAFARTVFDCGVCFVGRLGSECVQLPECGHVFCQACLSEFCKMQIMEGNIRGVSCPEVSCESCPTPAQVQSLVGEQLFSRYDRLLLQSTLDLMPDVTYCPRLTCGLPVILEKSGSAGLCLVCRFAFCVACRKTYHGAEGCRPRATLKELIELDAHDGNLALPQSQEGLTALSDDYLSGSEQRRSLLQSRYGRRVMKISLPDILSEDWIVTNSKSCPHCFTKIQKDGGCNKMTCSLCRQYFCWLCMTRLTRDHRHFQDGGCPLFQYDI